MFNFGKGRAVVELFQELRRLALSLSMSKICKTIMQLYHKPRLQRQEQYRTLSEASKSSFEWPCACVRDLVRVSLFMLPLGPWPRLEGIEKAERNVPKVWLNWRIKSDLNKEQLLSLLLCTLCTPAIAGKKPYGRSWKMYWTCARLVERSVPQQQHWLDITLQPFPVQQSLTLNSLCVWCPVWCCTSSCWSPQLPWMSMKLL